jgi:hypothetical protein
MRSLLLFLLALSAQAHEIGTTRVAVTFPEPGAYLIEIATDPEALKEKWQGGEAAFLARVDLRFDGVRATPSMRQEGGAIRLTGVLPAGAQTFTWKYGWTFASYGLTVGPNSVWLDGGETSAPIAVAAPAPGRWRVLGQYLVLGFTHILPLGWDHMLFILGLFLASSSLRSLLAQATLFTVAHSITLGLAMFNVFRLPAEIVEPAILLSIVYIFFERRAAARRRLALVFGFGLLHGMAFASVLTELGLPRAEFVTALAGFNLGVEAAQLAVIGICYLGATQSANLSFVNWRWAALRRAG